MDTSPPLPVPRLRLTRHSPQLSSPADTLTPIAGPSRFSPHTNIYENNEDEDDAESTPRMPSQPIVPDADSPRAPAQSALPTDTPAARLRALLARVPNNNTPATPHASTSRIPQPATPSEPDSDLDPPYSITATPSIARESLKELFSHALRDPGTTPQKGRPRRNSVDASEVDPSPRIEKARARSKGKRRSMSDEEADHLSNVSRRSEDSGRSSHAATFDALRERLAQSRSTFPTLPLDQMVMDMSMPPDDSRTVLRDLSRPQSTPPHATSTPMRSFPMQSNLLEGDSEMQKALGGMDSYEGDSLPNGRPLSFPPSRPNAGTETVSPVRPLSWTSHSKSHSAHNLPLARRVSEELDSSTSRASSSQSGADYRERVDETQRERIHERERKWNHPVPKSPGYMANGSGSPARTLSRQSSAASLQSTDDGRSSRASSVASRSDYSKEAPPDRQKEREREWNKPKSALSRSASSLSLRDPERTRTSSQPTRPDSAQSFLTPARRTLSRHSSFNSLSSSSRAGSPAGSVKGEEEPEVVQERERNWNSPRPRWSSHSSRAPSPMPNSHASSSRLSLPKANTPPKSQSPRPQVHVRQRADSSASQKSLSFRDEKSGSRSVAATEKASPKHKGAVPPRSKSPPLPSRTGNRVSHDPSSHESNQTSHDHAHDSTQASSFRSRFGWSFPQNRTQLPPLELEVDSPEKPKQAGGSRPSSRLGVSRLDSAEESKIPVRSPSKDRTAGSTLRAEVTADRRRGHRRSLTEFSQSVGAIPPRIVEPDPEEQQFHVVSQEDSVFASDEDSPPATSTPTARPIVLPPSEARSSPPTSPTSKRNSNSDASSLQKIIAKPDSPPPTPIEQSQPVFSLQTPPRPSLSNISKLDFKTPSPPRNMPDLPEPPSFTADDDAEDNEHTPVNIHPPGNLTAMKTPKPPGAWADTPELHRTSHDPFARAQSTPPESGETSSQANGFATPMSTWPRTTSVPAQTPAPPGAWMPTPGTSARRRSILKVRFDVESETTVSDSGAEHPEGESANIPEWNTGKQQFIDKLASARSDSDESGPLPMQGEGEGPSTPPSIPVRTPRKSPAVRVVDAFGREQKMEEETQETLDLPPVRASAQEIIRVKPSVAAPVPLTPRSKSAVKIVDAMGREVEEISEEHASRSGSPMSHNEALARVRQTIAHMADDLSEVDRSCETLTVEDGRLGALEDASKAARNARQKIAKSLQLVKTAENDLKSRYKPLRESMRKSRFLPTAIVERRLPWNASFLWGLVCVQLIIFLLMYRFSNLRAKRIFLTTYYDPFYADLYLYASKPDTFDHSIPSHPSWSIFSIPDTIYRTGWSGVVTELWGNATLAFRRTSEFWSPNYRGQTPSSWPPT